MKKIILGLAAAMTMAWSAWAADLKPAVVYDLGGKNDKSFNEAAYAGAERFKKEAGMDYKDFEKLYCIGYCLQAVEALIEPFHFINILHGGYHQFCAGCKVKVDRLPRYACCFGNMAHVDTLTALLFHQLPGCY